MRKLWHKARPRDWWEWLAAVGVIGTFLFGMLVVYWLHFQDNPPLVVNNAPLPVVGEQDVYKPGDTIRFDFDFCRRSRGEITRTRRWIDGLMYTEPPLTIAGGERECVHTTLLATVPNIPPGRYSVEYDLRYHVNPLASRLVTFRTAYFEVVAGE